MFYNSGIHYMILSLKEIRIKVTSLPYPQNQFYQYAQRLIIIRHEVSDYFAVLCEIVASLSRAMDRLLGLSL